LINIIYIIDYYLSLKCHMVQTNILTGEIFLKNKGEKVLF